MTANNSNHVLHGTPLKKPEEILAKLKEEFPPDVVEQKPGGRGKMLDYIPGWAVEERLDEATGGIWSAELLWTETDKIMVSRRDGIVPRDVVYSFIRLTIPGLGTRVGRGVQVKEEGSGEDVIKGAETDGLKVAAAKFGVARYLYRGGASSSQQQNYGSQQQQQQQQQQGQRSQGGFGNQRTGDAVSEAQWGKFNAMTQKLGIDPNSIIKVATNGFDMNTVNKRGMSMTIDKLTKIESGEERWDGAPAPEQSDAGNSGRFGGQQQPPPPPSSPSKDQLLGRIRNANSGPELDSIYDEMVMLMVQDDPELMTALGDRANQIGN